LTFQNKLSLSTLPSLEWHEWPSLPVEMMDAQSVWLNGTLLVGGGYSNTSGDAARLYSFTPESDTEWSYIVTPTYFFGLVAHNSQILLVGGSEYPSGETTNKIFTLRGGEFIETLPPMMESRSDPSVVSNGSVLVVAGGCNDSGILCSVEFLESGQWKKAPSLPRGGSEMSSTLNGDQSEWYLINDDKEVYSVSLSSLISGTVESPWKTLPDAPHDWSAAAFFAGHLLSIGGGKYGNPTTAINAFSTVSQSWEHVASLPVLLEDSTAIALPNGKLAIIGGETLDDICNSRVLIGYFSSKHILYNTLIMHVVMCFRYVI